MKLILSLEKFLIDCSMGMKKAAQIAGSVMDYKPLDEIDLEKFCSPSIIKSAMEVYNIKEIEAKVFFKWYGDYFNRIGKYENEYYKGALELLNDLKKDYDISVFTELYSLQARQILRKKDILKDFELVGGKEKDRENNDKYHILETLVKNLKTKDEIVFISSDMEDIKVASELLLNNIYYDFSENKEINVDFIRDKVEQIK
ncbi:HAD hydrolase-like protein [Peptoniphilus lacrimalis]|uniref:HAD hydrolase-like protein n=1 Tax=Peptoniphilus lacrimalis TaxID=33031 RepID=UPI00254C4E64|nr:HAD hydrolase-like protein [Peptoniphilus lacrimalis]MDK7721925.1 HAD hydrolase-like protein [Peptoniphilus lacrimalis]MDK7731527.1 HAD hydrolase-like protein [Peptoniphilus lacrimalis]